MYNLNLVSAINAGTRFIKPVKEPNIIQYSNQTVNLEDKRYSESYNKSKGKLFPNANIRLDKNSNLEQNQKPNTSLSEDINRNETQQITNAKKKNDSRSESTTGSQISQNTLQEAVIWSEILGKPLCKRGKRR